MNNSIRLPLVALGMGALLLAAGCHTLGMSSCSNPATYASAQEIPTLKMPVGLEGPDTSQAMKIPPLNQPEVPRGADAPCLENPPEWKDRPASSAGALPAQQQAPDEAPQRRRPSGPPR